MLCSWEIEIANLNHFEAIWINLACIFRTPCNCCIASIVVKTEKAVCIGRYSCHSVKFLRLSFAFSWLDSWVCSTTTANEILSFGLDIAENLDRLFVDLDQTSPIFVGENYDPTDLLPPSANLVGMLEGLALKHEGHHHSGLDDCRNIARTQLSVMSKRWSSPKTMDCCIRIVTGSALLFWICLLYKFLEFCACLSACSLCTSLESR